MLQFTKDNNNDCKIQLLNASLTLKYTTNLS